MFGKNGIFRAAPGTHNGVARATHISGFLGRFYFIFNKHLKDKVRFMHTQFHVYWMEIIRDITKFSKLSEQPLYLKMSDPTQDFVLYQS